MYAYHPVFDYVKKFIKKKKLGPIEYVISNFRYPSLKKMMTNIQKILVMVFIMTLQFILFHWKIIFLNLKINQM